MPGEPGGPHQGVVIHSLLARSEERLVATFDRRSTEVLRELRRVSNMLDRLVQLYLAHTPEVPAERRDSAIASANRRYASYQHAVTERVAEADRVEAAPQDADKELTA